MSRVLTTEGFIFNSFYTTLWISAMLIQNLASLQITYSLIKIQISNAKTKMRPQKIFTLRGSDLSERAQVGLPGMIRALASMNLKFLGIRIICSIITVG
jgi:hypothetical protein